MIPPYLLLLFLGSARSQATVAELHGSGAVLYAPYARTVADELIGHSRAPVKIDYRTPDPVAAIEDFMGTRAGADVRTDFMFAGRPLSSANYNTLVSQGKKVFHVVTGFRTVGFFANFPGLLNSGVVPNITGCELAKILLGQITSWSDPALVSLHPLQQAYPGIFSNTTQGLARTKITVVAQTGSLVADMTMSEYLTQTCPSVWTAGIGETAAPVFNGNATVLTVDSLDATDEAVWANNYAIAWKVIDEAIDRGLTVFALETPSGAFAQPSKKAAEQAIEIDFAGNTWPAIDADWSGQDLVFSSRTPAQASAWPTAEAVYLIFQLDDLTSLHAGLAKMYALLFFHFGNQDNIAASLGFGPLLPAIQTYMTTQINLTIPDAGLGSNAFYLEESLDGTPTHDANYSVSNLRTIGWRDQLDLLDAQYAAIQTKIYSSLSITLDGSGSALVGMYIGQVMSTLRDRAKVPINIGFRALGTSAGIAEFFGDPNNNYKPYVNFGVGEAVLTTAQHDTLTAAGVKVVQIPVVASTLGFYHSVNGFDATTGPMNLTACLLIDIMMRKITTWNDNRIVDMNPEWRLFQYENPNLDYTIKIAYRTGGSSTTYKIQQYFVDASKTRCPGAFPYTPLFTSTYFPKDANTMELENDSDLAAYLSQNPMTLSYVALGPARDQSLHEILIDDADGQYRSPLTSTPYSALNISEFPKDPSQDYKGLNFVFRPKSYPIVLISYFWVHQDASYLGDTSALLKAFMQLIVSDEGQAMLPSFGMFPLPADILEFSRSSLSMVVVDPSAQPFITESGTALMGVGAGPRVLSSLRTSITQYEMDKVATQLNDQAKALGLSFQAMSSRISVLEVETYPDAKARATSAAAIAFGVLGIVMAIANLVIAYCWLVSRNYAAEEARESRDSDDGGSPKGVGRADVDKPASKYAKGAKSSSNK